MIKFKLRYYEDDGDYFRWSSDKTYLDMNRTMTFIESTKKQNRKGKA